MSNNKFPSFTSNSGKTRSSITHMTGQANSSGGYVSVGGEISHQVGKNTTIYTSGQIGHSQSFNGGGGRTSGSGQIGITHGF